MREILFRGKSLDFGDWLCGYIRQYEDGKITICDFETKRLWFVDPSTVGQFIGLTDKNGKKVFEGDIVKIGSFMPGEDGFVCAVDWDYSFFDEYKYVWKTKCEVIGNIYDNPELLEVIEDD